MKKDIFMVWLKEFCSLIFTQTVQAFLLAIVMSVVVATASNGSMEEQGTAVSATGIIAIIALASISKVELLVKKIFGVESQFGDPAMKNGMGALAGSLIAAKLAGRALNNVPKMASGLKGLDTRKARANALAKRNRDLAAAAGKRSGGSGVAAGNIALQQAGGASAGSGSATTTTGSGLTTAQNVVTSAQGIASDSKLTAEKFNKINDEYEKAIAEINKNRRESLKKLASGTLETATLPVGAIGGIAVGLATGDNPLKAAGVGIGATDYVSEKLVSGVSAMGDAAREFGAVSKAQKSAVDAINQSSRAIMGANATKVDSYRDAKIRDRELTVRIKNDIDAGRI
jgi:hypothetical protein